MKKVLLVICSIIGVVIVCKFGFEENNPYDTICIQPECNNERVEGSIYCKDHKPSKEDAELDDCLHDMVPYVEDTTEENTKETTTYSYYNSSGSSSYGGSSSYSNSSSSYSSSTKKKSSSTGGYSSYSSGSSSSSQYKSYDEGYEAIYDDDDYDWDRYNSDSDYADGVDDALDELDD